MPRHDRIIFPLSTLIAVLMSTACVEPDYSKITVLCPAESPLCPVGMVCVSGQCRAASGDAAVSTDGSGDLGAVDMTTGTICPNGRDQIFGQAVGCPGAFTAGKASQQCPATWSPCPSAVKVDLAACKAASSFFASAVSGYNLGAETCGSAIGNQLLYGCGNLGRDSTAQCGGFPKVIDVKGPWATTDGTLATASLTDMNQGVLCCPP